METTTIALVNTQTTDNIGEGTDAQQRMTSLEIAELCGKQHNDVMKAIRKMEPAWARINQGNFSLVEYRDKKGELRPCYSLTKTETLYIATKFCDEARARLVLRWEVLERERMEGLVAAARQRAALPSPQEIVRLADGIVGAALREMNASAHDTLTATQVAKTFNMTVMNFNLVLRDMGIQYRHGGRWCLSQDLAGRGLTEVRTHVSYSLRGEKKIRSYMTWTMRGLHYLNAKLGYPNF
ncbi:MAG: phage regulatory protein/antirepressor Ant [Prevotella sp.]|nr:phage regulatory protein/antirepressor Ant [Prevotella sp.]